MDRGASQATVHGVTKTQTQLKRLSTHTQVSKYPEWCKDVTVRMQNITFKKPQSQPPSAFFCLKQLSPNEGELNI